MVETQSHTRILPETSHQVNTPMGVHHSMIDHLIRNIGKTEGGITLVDLGCGKAPHIPHNGEVSITYIGVDVSHEKIIQAQAENPDNMFIVGDAKTFATAQGKTDIVTCARTLIWCDNPFVVIQNAYNMLKPGGVIIATEPDWQWERGFYVHSSDPKVNDISKEMSSFKTIPIHSPDCGIHLQRMMIDAGFVDVEVVGWYTTDPMSTARKKYLFDTRVEITIERGIITQEEGEIWLNAVADVSLIRYTVGGKKPHA